MAGRSEAMSQEESTVQKPWRSADPVRGMSDFARWWGGTGLKRRAGVSPADVDCLLHNKKGNAFLMIEFKPAGTDIADFRAQAITLRGFSELPNCMSLMVFDPHWDSISREEYSPEEKITIIPFIDGEQKSSRTVTMHAFQQRIAEWWEKGF